MVTSVKRTDVKSHCPINFGLEMFGDQWSLLIVRDIVYFGKHTYGEFLASEESMSTSILAIRLLQLEQKDILSKQQHPDDKRKDVYSLTEKGIALIPVLLEIANWSFRFDPETIAPKAWITAVNRDKPRLTALIQETVREGGSIFVGEYAVIKKLH